MYIMWLASSYMLSATIYRFTELKQKLGANRVPFLLPSQAWYKILSLSRVESTAKRKSEQEGKGRGSQAAVARERKTGKRSLLIKSLERFPSTLFFVSLALTCRFFFFFLYLFSLLNKFSFTDRWKLVSYLVLGRSTFVKSES